MKLNHTKLNETPSTQEYLKELISSAESSPFTYHLVSTRYQSDGFGRQGRSWTQLSQTICFSFSLPKRENLTISSAEISLLTLKYLKNQFQFLGKLKWPNDILDEKNLKVAGILIDIIKESLVVGIGINIGKSEQDSNLEASFVSQKQNLNDEDFHKIPLDIYKYIIESYPQEPIDIINEWNQSCAHLDTKIKITDESNVVTGIFKGLGEHGEALIYTDCNELKSVFNGTLRLVEST